MSILSFPTSHRQPGSLGVTAAARRLWAGAMQAWRNRQATRAMAELSDAMLHDIGITRSEIDHAARYGRPPRR